MKEIFTQKGTFIVVPHGTPHLNENEIIGLVSEILKDEEKAKMVVDFESTPISHRTLFQNLVEDCELKESDLIIKKL